VKTGWKKLPFEEVIADVSGGNVKTPQGEFLQEGQFAIVDQGKELISGYANEEKRLCHADLPVIIFGDHTRCFKYVDFPFCMGADGVKVLRPKIDANVKYLYYYLRQLHITNAGYSRHFKYLKQSEVVLPPLDEQKRIADILDRAEALRAKRRAALDQLDELTQSIFIEMFEDPRSPTKRKNEKIRLRDVIDIIVPTRDKPKSFTGNIPWITLPDLANSIYIEDSKYKLSKEEARPTKTRLFPKETVILSCAGSLGKVAISTNEVYTNQQFYGLVCDKKRIIPEFLAYYLLLLGEDYYRGISGTSTLAFFKKESALNIEIMLPEISNQIHFSQTVKQIEKIRKSQQKSLREINNLFDSLAHEAFTGKLFSHQFFEQEIENGVKI